MATDECPLVVIGAGLGYMEESVHGEVEMIEMGKEYQTRDGRTVRILATDVRGTEFPILGLIPIHAGRVRCLVR